MESKINEITSYHPHSFIYEQVYKKYIENHLTDLESNMKPGEIELKKPARNYEANIDGYKLNVTAIAIHDEPRINAKHVVLEGYAYPNIRVSFDSFEAHNIFPYYIDRVVFSGPMTIVFWNDGTKTKVRVHEEKGKKKAIYDKYTAITWAMAKKYYGSRSQLEKRLRDICDDSKYDNMLVYTMVSTLFGDPKKLDEYVDNALNLAEDYNQK